MTVVTVLVAEAKIAPSSFFVKCGEMKIRFDQKKFWNMNYIEYKGKTICIDKPGAHYGTVIKFPRIGFIGSGHTENEEEKIISLDLKSDGEKINLRNLKDNAVLLGNKFTLIRKSRIKNIEIENHIEISLKTITETVKLRSDKKVQLSLMYNFMHPWNPLIKYMAKLVSGEIITGNSYETNKFYVEKETEWLAFYSDKLRIGVVSKLIKSYKKTKNISRVWDRNVYLKYYLMSFRMQEFPANTAVVFKMITKLFDAAPDKWHEKAKIIGTGRFQSY